MISGGEKQHLTYIFHKSCNQSASICLWNAWSYAKLAVQAGDLGRFWRLVWVGWWWRSRLSNDDLPIISWIDWLVGFRNDQPLVMNYITTISLVGWGCLWSSTIKQYQPLWTFPLHSKPAVAMIEPLPPWIIPSLIITINNRPQPWLLRHQVIIWHHLSIIQPSELSAFWAWLNHQKSSISHWLIII